MQDIKDEVERIEWEEVVYGEDEWPDEIEFPADDLPRSPIPFQCNADEKYYLEIEIQVPFGVAQEIKVDSFVTVDGEYFKVICVISRSDSLIASTSSSLWVSRLRLRVEPVTD